MSDHSGNTTALDDTFAGPRRSTVPPDAELEALVSRYQQQVAAARTAVPAEVFAVPPAADVAPPVGAAAAAHLAETPTGYEAPGQYQVPAPVVERDAAPGFFDPSVNEALFLETPATPVVPAAPLPEWRGPEVVGPRDPASIFEMGDAPTPWAAYEAIEDHPNIPAPELIDENKPVVAPLPVDVIPSFTLTPVAGAGDDDSYPEPLQPPTSLNEAPAVDERLFAAPESTPVPQPAEFFDARSVQLAAQPESQGPSAGQAVVEANTLVPAEPAVFSIPAAQSPVAESVPSAPPVATGLAAAPAEPQAAPVVYAPQPSFDADDFFNMDSTPRQPTAVPEYTVPGPVVPGDYEATPVQAQPYPEQPVYPQGAPGGQATPAQTSVYAAPAEPQSTLTQYDPREIEQSPLASAAKGAPIQEWLDYALRDLTAMRASDIHLSMSGTSKEMLVEARRDGRIEPVRLFSRGEGDIILNLLKTRAEISTGSTSVPSDGRYGIEIGNYPYRIRAVALPLFDGGQKIVLRLPQLGAPKPLSELGFTDGNLAETKKLLAKPGGMIVIAGPMGEGKTSTAHAALEEIGGTGRIVITVEDPVERILPGVGQIEVNEDIGSGFGEIMKYLVRADFDTLFIGEIRDSATAAAAVRMAKAGRRVISTIHATDNVTALLRLIELSSDTPLSVLDAVRGVVSQRLVRKLGDGPEGYLGRYPIHEILTVNEALVEELISSQSLHRIREAAAKTSTTFEENINQLIGEGITDAREKVRVLGLE